MSDTQRIKITLELDISPSRYYEAFDVGLGEGHRSRRLTLLALLRAAELDDVHNVTFTTEHGEDEDDQQAEATETGVPF